MSKVKGKGTVFKMTISASLTALAQLIEFGISGTEAQTYNSTTLDTSTYETFDLTGYATPGDWSGSLFHDPALAGHKFITSIIDTPATNACQITYADAGLTTQAFTGTGWKFGNKVVMNDGLKADVGCKITGNPGWPT